MSWAGSSGLRIASRTNYGERSSEGSSVAKDAAATSNGNATKETCPFFETPMVSASPEIDRRRALRAMMRRFGAPEEYMLVAKGNLAVTYAMLGRLDESMRLRQDVYYGTLKLHGEENRDSLREANNYAADLSDLQRHAQAKSLLRKTIPVARRLLGENNDLTLRMRLLYGGALYRDAGATLDDLREAVTTLEETERVLRRVLGGSHPLTVDIEGELPNARAVLRARDTSR